MIRLDYPKAKQFERLNGTVDKPSTSFSGKCFVMTLPNGIEVVLVAHDLIDLVRAAHILVTPILGELDPEGAQDITMFATHQVTKHQFEESPTCISSGSSDTGTRS